MNVALVLNTLSLSLLGYWLYNKKSQNLYPKENKQDKKNIDDNYPLTELILGNRKYQHTRKKQKTAVIVYGDVDVKEIFQTNVYVIRYREPFDYDESIYVDIALEIEYCYEVLGIKTFIFLGHIHNPRLLKKSVVFDYTIDNVRDVVKNESKQILIRTSEVFGEILKEGIQKSNVKLYYATLEETDNVTIYHYIF